MKEELLRSKEKGVLRFRFLYTPELITVGQSVLFREGHFMIFGQITSVD